MNNTSNNIRPTRILVNGKQIMPGKFLNLEYQKSTQQGVNGGSILSNIPIIGSMLDGILGTGLFNDDNIIKSSGAYTPNYPQGYPTTMYGNTPYNYGTVGAINAASQQLYRNDPHSSFEGVPLGNAYTGVMGGNIYNGLHTQKPYTPLETYGYPLLSGCGVGNTYPTNYMNQNINGGFIQYIPAVLTAVDLLSNLFRTKGGALSEYTRYLDEPKREMMVEFQDANGSELFKTMAQLNRMGMHLLHKPEVVADILAKGKGIRGNMDSIRPHTYSTGGNITQQYDSGYGYPVADRSMTTTNGMVLPMQGGDVGVYRNINRL